MTVLHEYCELSVAVADPSMLPDVEPMVTAFAPPFSRLMVMGCWPLRSIAVGSVTVNAPPVAFANITRSNASTVYVAVTEIAYHGNHPGIVSNERNPASDHVPTCAAKSSGDGALVTG